jgi:hypothetical protein
MSSFSSWRRLTSLGSVLPRWQRRTVTCTKRLRRYSFMTTPWQERLPVFRWYAPFQ